VQGLLQDARRFHEAVTCACKQREEKASQAERPGEPSEVSPRFETDTIHQAKTHVLAAWGTLCSEEQVRILRLVVERVDYNGVKRQATLTYQSAGLIALVAEWAAKPQEPLL
jgi:hypothetical protein